MIQEVICEDKFGYLIDQEVEEHQRQEDAEILEVGEKLVEDDQSFVAFILCSVIAEETQDKIAMSHGARHTRDNTVYKMRGY